MEGEYGRVGIERFWQYHIIYGFITGTYQFQHGIIRTKHLLFTMFCTIIYICIIHERWSLRLLQRVKRRCARSVKWPKSCNWNSEVEVLSKEQSRSSSTSTWWWKMKVQVRWSKWANEQDWAGKKGHRSNEQTWGCVTEPLEWSSQ